MFRLRYYWIHYCILIKQRTLSHQHKLIRAKTSNLPLLCGAGIHIAPLETSYGIYIKCNLMNPFWTIRRTIRNIYPLPDYWSWYIYWFSWKKEKSNFQALVSFPMDSSHLFSSYETFGSYFKSFQIMIIIIINTSVACHYVAQESSNVYETIRNTEFHEQRNF